MELNVCAPNYLIVNDASRTLIAFLWTILSKFSGLAAYNFYIIVGLNVFEVDRLLNSDFNNCIGARLTQKSVAGPATLQ
jgi:hypothetical protein